MAYSAEVKKWRSIAAKNPAGFVNYRLRIPDLMGNDVKFQYKWGQKIASDFIKEQHKTGKPCRVWIVKWRRAGITASRSAEGYAHAYGTNNARIGVIAHLEDRAKEILNNYRIYDESIQREHPELFLEKAKDNIFGLKFKQSNSQILIATAMNPIKVRGDGLHWLEGSEAAHWYSHFDTVMKEVCPVVPAERGSQIILESTGSLIGSQRYVHWLEADQGKNEFTTLFLCWLDDPGMRIPFLDKKQEYELYEKINHIEPRLAEKNKHYKLSPEQIHMSWMLFFYQSKCDFEYFCREFPYTKREAWSAGGASYFGVYEIGKAKPRHPEEIYVFDQGNITQVFQSPSELRRVDSVDDYANRPNIKFWKPPQRGAKYCIGTDGSSGDYGGDYSAGYLIDMHTGEDMAAYHGLLRPDEAAHITVSLCRLYNNALAAPETNPAGGGMEALNTIQRLGYHNIYNWRRRDGFKGIENTRSLGWWTHSRSRPLMLGELRKLFIDSVQERSADPNMFKDAALIQEMATFSTNPATGIPEANANCYDDRVIAKAIVVQVASDENYCTSKDRLFQKARAESRPAISEESMVSKRRSPNDVVNSFISPNSNFNRNKFEI